jgi:DNA polymerase III subunit alpha
MSFVHLRTHTEYSVVDGILRVDDAVGAAARDSQAACAITDLSNLFGAIKFYTAARKKGVKPIIGCDLWLEPESGEKQGSRLLVLVQNHQGYLNLCELLARAWSGNTQRSHAFVKWEWFETHGAGLLVLSGADGGAVGQALLAGDVERAEMFAQRLAALFPQRFFIELQRAGPASNERYVRAAVPLAAKLKLPVVATHPVQFLEPDDFEAHEARVCVAEGETLANPKRIKRFSREQYFKTAAQMEALFADLPVAVSNTLAIAQRCNLQLTLGKPQLPDFPTPGGVPIDQHFRDASHAGLEVRLAQLYPDATKREAERSRYVERLEFELNTIIKMGFPGYFLIVADFIQWAKSHGCPVGPGRGSGAGSLVAYSLLITDLDPLQYNLLFERFLNPERVSMPDFDIDFCQANRERVIDYVKDKYGRDAVSQIATFGTMAAKAALRDVGRVLGMGYGHVDSIAKLVVAPPGKTVTLAKVPLPPDLPIEGILYARKEEPEIDRREAAEEEVAELLALATRVEGIVRNVGMHAGGVLIAPGKITDFCPLYQQPGSDSAVSQFDKDDVEAIGLVKFDFLGLATLTILELAKEMVRARRKGRENFDYAQLPLDDAATYRIFAEGKTESVFQFESRGMVGMLRDAKPSKFEDLIALNALYRPGPMDSIPSFCARKHGREPITYPHPLLEDLLRETYGVIVYQEHVMQGAQIMAGYSLGGADLLRRAMGKKKPEEMAQQRALFRAGSAKNGVTQEQADEVFDLMEKFAGYGFNKCHAAAYVLLSYHTGWLKAHCTAEFYAANMTVELDNTDKLKVLLADAKQFDVSFEPPDINRGSYRFEPVSDTVVRYGLGAIKGTGQGAIEAIIAVRDGTQGEGGGPFRSLFDFAARIDRQRVNKRVVEALIKAGAFDALHVDRASALASVGLAFDWADTQDVNEHQGGLFDFDDSHAASTQEPALIRAEPWSIKERLTAEKTALGFYLSGHLFEEYAPEVRQFCKRNIADLVDSREPQVLAGIVSDLRVINGNRGRTAIFRLDDGSEYIEAVAAEELYDANRERLREDELVIIQGKVQNDRFSNGLRLQCNAVWDLPSARARFGRYLSVAVNGKAPPVADVIKTWPPRSADTAQGQTQQGLTIRLQLHRGQAEGVIDLGEQARFWPSDEALARWRTLAHEGRAAVVYE